MATKRRQQILLALLLVVLAVAGYRAWTSTSAVTLPASNATSPAPAARRTAQPPQTAASAPDVHLEALDADRPKPGLVERDLFRF